MNSFQELIITITNPVLTPNFMIVKIYTTINGSDILTIPSFSLLSTDTLIIGDGITSNSFIGYLKWLRMFPNSQSVFLNGLCSLTCSTSIGFNPSSLYCLLSKINLSSTCKTNQIYDSDVNECVGNYVS